MKTANLTVPYFDLKAQFAACRSEILSAIERVCQNASFILGEEVERFEGAFATYCGARHCVAVNSGTSALHLALLSAGIGTGDEVITTANTFVATVEAICYSGARPRFVDIDPSTANIDPDLLEQAITGRTKAIIPVHLYGRPADMDPIVKIAKAHNLTVIEDACQAHGASYRGKTVGGFGHAAAFSFYPGKNLGAYGEAGAITTNDDRVANFARSLRDHGQGKRYFHDYVGYNYRMDGFQGAVLNVKLKRLPEWTAKRQEFAQRYRHFLAGSSIELPKDRPEAQSAYHLFVAYVEQRDRVRSQLLERGVQTGVHYPVPVHLQKAYSSLGYGPGSLPHTERACERVFSMPLFPELSLEQVEYAAAALVASTLDH